MGLKRKQFLSFEEARDYVRSIGLKTNKEWLNYCKSGEKHEEHSKYLHELVTKDNQDEFNRVSANRASYLLNLELIRKSNLKRR